MKITKPVRALYCSICEPQDWIACDAICPDIPPVNVPCTKWTC